MSETKSFREQGNEKYHNRQYVLAIELYDKSIVAKETNPELSFLNKAVSQFKLCQYDEALRSIEDALSQNRFWAKAWLRKAVVLQAKKDKKGALLSILQAGSHATTESEAIQKEIRELKDKLIKDGTPVLVSPLYPDRTPQPTTVSCSNDLPVQAFVQFFAPIISKEVAEYYNAKQDENTLESIDLVAQHPVEKDLEKIFQMPVGEFLRTGGVFFYKELITRLDVPIKVFDQDGKSVIKYIDRQLPFKQLQTHLQDLLPVQNNAETRLEMNHPIAKDGTVADFHGSGGFALRITQNLKKLNLDLLALHQKNATLEAEVDKYKAEAQSLKENVTEEHQKTIAELKGEIARLMKENATLKKDISATREETVALREQNDLLQEQLDEMQHTIVQLETKLARQTQTSDQKILMLEQQQATFQQQHAIFQQQLSEIQKEHEQNNRILRIGQVMLLTEDKLRRSLSFSGKLLHSMKDPLVAERVEALTKFKWQQSHYDAFKSFTAGRISIAHQLKAFTNVSILQSDVAAIADPQERQAVQQLLNFVFADKNLLQEMIQNKV